MARSHVEFIQAQVLPWQRGVPGTAARDDVEAKVLSRDSESGACSLLVRYPAGWVRATPERLAADEEFLVLEGQLAINGRSYRPYGYLPAGYERRVAAAPGGAVILTFFEGAPHARATGACDTRKLIEHLDTDAMPWTPVIGIPNMRSGIATRVLGVDPDNRERTWFLMAPPGGRTEGAVSPMEIHPVVEEMFVLSGVLVTERGAMQPGAYFWRPPGEPHGPGGSRTGNLLFFRCKGGPLDVLWSEKTVAYSFEAGHNPILPPELAALGARPYRGALLY